MTIEIRKVKTWIITGLTFCVERRKLNIDIEAQSLKETIPLEIQQARIGIIEYRYLISITANAYPTKVAIKIESK